MSTEHTTAGPLVAELPQGDVSYRAAGPRSSSHPPVVFVHGLLVDARLWEPVAERLAADGIRSYAPTLPLGSHQRPMNADADLSPQGIAALTRDFLRGARPQRRDHRRQRHRRRDLPAHARRRHQPDRRRGADQLRRVRHLPAPGPRAALPRPAPSRTGRLPGSGAPVASRTARPARLRAAQQRPARRRADPRLGPAAGRQGDPSRPRQVRQGRPAGPPPRRRQPVRPVHRAGTDPAGATPTRTSASSWDGG